SSDWEDFADGRILSGKDAQKLGFVDQVGDLEVALTKAEELGHVSKNQANLIQYEPLFDLSNLFHLFGESNAKSATIKLDLGLDVILVPVLRAGLGMLDSILQLIPHARVGFIGLKREEKSLQAVSYHESLPRDLRRFEVLLIDPMLATGGSSVAALNLLSKRG